MTSRFRTPVQAACLLLLLSACRGPYTVRLNDQVVYTPNPDAIGILEDPNFQGCLNLVLGNNDSGDPGQLSSLACPAAGITSLRGIDALGKLQQLDLSGNAITDLGPLATLKELRILSVRDNDLRSITALNSLPLLRFVSLQGNPAIPCRQLDELQGRLGNTLERPATCN